jgi:hypothetical protein
VSRESPGPGCRELAIEGGLELAPFAQVALEDYARAATGASAAAVVTGEDASRVLALHLCGTGGEPPDAVREDVLAFARELAQREGGGLGWS